MAAELHNTYTGGVVSHIKFTLVLKECVYWCGKVQHWKKVFACNLEAVLTALIRFSFQVNLPLSLSRDNYLGHDTSIAVLLQISELNVAELFQESFYSLHLVPYVWESQHSLLFIWQVQSYVWLSFLTCVSPSAPWKTAILSCFGGSFFLVIFLHR